MAVKTTSKTKTINRGGTSTAARKMNKGGIKGASPKPKPVAKPAGGTKMGGGKPAGGKRGC